MSYILKDESYHDHALLHQHYKHCKENELPTKGGDAHKMPVCINNCNPNLIIMNNSILNTTFNLFMWRSGFIFLVGCGCFENVYRAVKPSLFVHIIILGGLCCKHTILCNLNSFEKEKDNGEQYRIHCTFSSAAATSSNVESNEASFFARIVLGKLCCKEIIHIYLMIHNIMYILFGCGYFLKCRQHCVLCTVL